MSWPLSLCVLRVRSLQEFFPFEIQIRPLPTSNQPPLFSDRRPRFAREPPGEEDPNRHQRQEVDPPRHQKNLLLSLFRFSRQFGKIRRFAPHADFRVKVGVGIRPEDFCSPAKCKNENSINPNDRDASTHFL